jgi:hypothetical protein
MAGWLPPSNSYERPKSPEPKRQEIKANRKLKIARLEKHIEIKENDSL